MSEKEEQLWNELFEGIAQLKTSVIKLKDNNEMLSKKNNVLNNVLGEVYEMVKEEEPYEKIKNYIFEETRKILFKNFK